MLSTFTNAIWVRGDFLRAWPLVDPVLRGFLIGTWLTAASAPTAADLAVARALRGPAGTQHPSWQPFARCILRRLQELPLGSARPVWFRQVDHGLTTTLWRAPHGEVTPMVTRLSPEAGWRVLAVGPYRPPF